MDLREEFVLRAKAPGANISELCREQGISRKTGYKWLRRFEAKGVEALQDMTRRPRRVELGKGQDYRIIRTRPFPPAFPARWRVRRSHR